MLYIYSRNNSLTNVFIVCHSLGRYFCAIEISLAMPTTYFLEIGFKSGLRPFIMTNSLSFAIDIKDRIGLYKENGTNRPNEMNDG